MRRGWTLMDTTHHEYPTAFGYDTPKSVLDVTHQNETKTLEDRNHLTAIVQEAWNEQNTHVFLIISNSSLKQITMLDHHYIGAKIQNKKIFN